MGFHSTLGLLATYAGRQSDLEKWLIAAVINHDGDLRLQYLAGMAVNNSSEAAIYDQIMSYRRWPERLFAGAEQRRQALREVITAPVQ